MTADSPDDRNTADRADRADRVTPGPTAGAVRPEPSPSSASPTNTPEPESPAAPDETDDAVAALEDEVVALINQERAAHDCAPVHTDPRLRAAARTHSTDMAVHEFLSHTGSDGSTPWDRARRAGYNDAQSENIAMGYRTAAEVVAGWMDSEGHRANILDCSAKATGVGVARTADGVLYWTQLFGRS